MERTSLESLDNEHLLDPYRVEDENLRGGNAGQGGSVGRTLDYFDQSLSTEAAVSELAQPLLRKTHFLHAIPQDCGTQDCGSQEFGASQMPLPIQEPFARTRAHMAAILSLQETSIQEEQQRLAQRHKCQAVEGPVERGGPLPSVDPMSNLRVSKVRGDDMAGLGETNIRIFAASALADNVILSQTEAAEAFGSSPRPPGDAFDGQLGQRQVGPGGVGDQGGGNAGAGGEGRGRRGSGGSGRDGGNLGGRGSGSGSGSGEENMSPGLRELRATARRIRRNTFILRFIDMSVWASLLVGEQITFKDTWHQECDLDLKIWATVWLATAVLKSVLYTLHALTLYVNDGRTVCGSLFKQPIVELFSFVWFAYGIIPLFAGTEKHCNASTAAWALFGFGFQAVCFFLPCLMVLLCVPCILCLLRVSWVRSRILPYILGPMEAPTNQQPTPESLLAKLPKSTYGEAVADNRIDLDSPSLVQPPRATPEALISTALPESFSQAVTSIMNRFGSDEANRATPAALNRSPFPVERGENDRGPAQAQGQQQGQQQVQQQGQQQGQPHDQRGEVPLAPVRSASRSGGANSSSNSTACPICFVEFAETDPIVMMPCDLRRHVFHDHCIVEWLKKSQHCPICRTNIVDMLSDLEAQDEGADAHGHRHSASGHRSRHGSHGAARASGT